ncbi:MAG: 8-amino-7-oxononanoate synthase [Verrucomicrobiota bacterium]|nr:8-amino-7-oxononanoate synthase [Verrucomicrobiota bacterium]
MSGIYKKLENELCGLRNNGRLRNLAENEDMNLLNLSSNDYLGLASDKDLLEEFYSGITDKTISSKYSMSASSSRLLTGNHSLYLELENELAKIYNAEAALFFNSGYHANIGILPALAGRKDLILSDKLNHASIIDGIRLADCAFKRYRHCDYEQLEKILSKQRSNYERVFIITESVFSMDGDIADLRKLVEIKKKYDAFLIVDEAHAVGVFGKNGCGICESQKVMQDIDMIIGTCGKALASIGAYTITNNIVRDFLINKMRSFIFTTALPPIVVNWNLFIIKKIPLMNGKRLRLAELSLKFRQNLSKFCKISGESQIIPFIVGADKATIDLAKKCRKNGFRIFPIRPPTVPQGTARLRISMTTEIEWEQLDKLLKCLR